MFFNNMIRREVRLHAIRWELRCKHGSAHAKELERFRYFLARKVRVRRGEWTLLAVAISYCLYMLSTYLLSLYLPNHRLGELLFRIGCVKWVGIALVVISIPCVFMGWPWLISGYDYSVLGEEYDFEADGICNLACALYTDEQRAATLKHDPETGLETGKDRTLFKEPPHA